MTLVKPDLQLGGVSFFKESPKAPNESLVLRPVNVPKAFQTPDGLLDGVAWVQLNIGPLVTMVCEGGQRLRVMDTELLRGGKVLPGKHVDWHTDGDSTVSTLIALANSSVPCSRGATLFADIRGMWRGLSSPEILAQLQALAEAMPGIDRTSQRFKALMQKPFTYSFGKAEFVLRVLARMASDILEGDAERARAILNFLESQEAAQVVSVNWSTFDTHAMELFGGHHLHRADFCMPPKEELEQSYLKRAVFTTNRY